MASADDVEESVSQTEAQSDSHSFWTHVVQAGDRFADMAVDVTAMLTIGWMAVEGVEPATLQVIGGMIVTVAIGKRYYQSKHNKQ